MKERGRGREDGAGAGERREAGGAAPARRQHLLQEGSHRGGHRRLHGGNIRRPSPLGEGKNRGKHFSLLGPYEKKFVYGFYLDLVYLIVYAVTQVK